jgi:hypothetical protein
MEQSRAPPGKVRGEGARHVERRHRLPPPQGHQQPHYSRHQSSILSSALLIAPPIGLFLVPENAAKALLSRKAGEGAAARRGKVPGVWREDASPAARNP